MTASEDTLHIFTLLERSVVFDESSHDLRLLTDHVMPTVFNDPGRDACTPVCWYTLSGSRVTFPEGVVASTASQHERHVNRIRPRTAWSVVPCTCAVLETTPSPSVAAAGLICYVPGD